FEDAPESRRQALVFDKDGPSAVSSRPGGKSRLPEIFRPDPGGPRVDDGVLCMEEPVSLDHIGPASEPSNLDPCGCEIARDIALVRIDSAHRSSKPNKEVTDGRIRVALLCFSNCD